MDKNDNDLRLIEDYLPIEAISAEASREKSVRKGHISTLHLWWARRPLVACRAAVYGALVPADRWFNGELPVHNVENGDPKKVEKWKNGAKRGLNRKAAKEFVTKLCRYPKSDPSAEKDIKIKRDTEAAIVEAQKHILEAHADRLTAELAEAKRTGKPPAWVEEFKFKGDRVAHADIIAGRAPRPRVLDMFAGGGAIPLEALRLGCEAYALDLNPVAHIIQLCTLVYPQKYGKPDSTAAGMTGPANAKGETTWGGLANEVRHWGSWLLERVRKEIGDLYPPVPDPAVWETPPEIAFNRQTGQWAVTKPGRTKRGVKLESLESDTGKQLSMRGDDEDEDDEGAGLFPGVQRPTGFLQTVAYLWTRAVRCKNPGCGVSVPLVRQTWLCKKAKRYTALKMSVLKNAKQVKFEVVESETESGLGFDPAGFSSGGNATCPVCGTVSDIDYVKAEGRAGRIASQFLAAVCTKVGQRGKIYFAAEDLAPELRPNDETLRKRTADLCHRSGITIPDESIANLPADCYDNTLGITVRPYGLTTFGHLFTPRQMLSLIAFAEAARAVHSAMVSANETLPSNIDHARSVATYCGLLTSTLSDWNCSLATWINTGEKLGHAFGRQALPMVWDFAELDPFGNASGNATSRLANTVTAIGNFDRSSVTDGRVSRGSATAQPHSDHFFDAVITDPPYYDNVPYADISDFFYVWLKRSIGHLYTEHFSSKGTPKKQEAVADATRHGGDKDKAVRAYEDMMSQSLSEAARVLRPGGTLAVVYAHKTTLGWSTLVDAFRRAGFVVTEAWPLDTEMKARLRGMDSAALASSIFLVGRKRMATTGVGNYEGDVQPELQQIVRERVETLWEMGIAGADLVIACVGAGLRAFTKYERVEYANGEEVPAEKFLAEVETAVLDSMLAKLSGTVGGNVSAVDNVSRFYVLWRFVYKAAELDAGESIIFANGTHVELDGPSGISDGKDALVEKKKTKGQVKYRARDFSERGDDAKLGLPQENGQSAPLIDALHRILWLMENSPRKLGEFLTDARPDLERVRVLAQALAGAALSGKSEEEAAKLVSTTAAEQAALGKLLANWRSLIEVGQAAAVVGKTKAREKEQATLDFGKGD